MGYFDLYLLYHLCIDHVPWQLFEIGNIPDRHEQSWFVDAQTDITDAVDEHERFKCRQLFLYETMA